MAKYVLNSSLYFARNIILAESKQFRSLPLLVAAKRYASTATTTKTLGNNEIGKKNLKNLTEIEPNNLKMENVKLKSFS